MDDAEKTAREKVREALRQRPTQIVVGEVRNISVRDEEGPFDGSGIFFGGTFK